MYIKYNYIKIIKYTFVYNEKKLTNNMTTYDPFEIIKMLVMIHYRTFNNPLLNCNPQLKTLERFILV